MTLGKSQVSPAPRLKVTDMKPVLNAVGLVVADMSAAVTFYEQLGVQFSRESADHWECELPSGLRLMLDSEGLMRSVPSEWTHPTGGV